jgi:hypothetical protein
MASNEVGKYLNSHSLNRIYWADSSLSKWTPAEKVCFKSEGEGAFLPKMYVSFTPEASAILKSLVWGNGLTLPIRL